jgi:putative transposase
MNMKKLSKKLYKMIIIYEVEWFLIIITSASKYFTGESFRNVQKFLKLHGVNITHVAIYKWIKKYVVLMKSCLEKITPNVAVAWR